MPRGLIAFRPNLWAKPHFKWRCTTSLWLPLITTSCTTTLVLKNTVIIFLFTDRNFLTSMGISSSSNTKILFIFHSNIIMSLHLSRCYSLNDIVSYQIFSASFGIISHVESFEFQLDYVVYPVTKKFYHVQLIFRVFVTDVVVSPPSQKFNLWNFMYHFKYNHLMWIVII